MNTKTTPFNKLTSFSEVTEEHIENLKFIHKSMERVSAKDSLKMIEFMEEILNEKKVKPFPKFMWNTQTEIYYILKENIYGKYSGILLESAFNFKRGQFSDTISKKIEHCTDYNGEIPDEWQITIDSFYKNLEKSPF